jgi:hypothetical protein
MTAPARISQADVERVVKGVKSGGYERAKMVFDFANRRIEVMIGGDDSPAVSANPWDSLLQHDTPTR